MNHRDLKRKVDALYNGDIELVTSKNVTMKDRISVSDKYGILDVEVRSLLRSRPTRRMAVNFRSYFINELKDRQPEVSSEVSYMISKQPSKAHATCEFMTEFGPIYSTVENLLKGSIPDNNSAVNKTEYFMNKLGKFFPNIANKITPLSEYKHSGIKMLFRTRYGIVSSYPSSIAQGHMPTVRTAVNRQSYNEARIKELYGDSLEFSMKTSSIVDCVCSTHGLYERTVEQLMSGNTCSMCDDNNVLYLVRLHNKSEYFYKVGISHRDGLGSIKRFVSYKSLGYNVEHILIKDFKNRNDALRIESAAKVLLKHNLYMPSMWAYETSTETFKDNTILSKMIDLLNIFMI